MNQGSMLKNIISGLGSGKTGPGVSSTDTNAVGSSDPEKMMNQAQDFARKGRNNSFWTAPEKLIDLKAETVATQEDLYDIIASAAEQVEEGEIYRDTCKAVADMLAAGLGGIILAVLHKKTLNNPDHRQYDYLDGGVHTESFRSLVDNVRDDAETFKILLAAFTAHNETDRWEHHELVDLVKKIPKASHIVHRLENQPKDGAMLLSHSGSVKAVSLHLKYTSKQFQLVKDNGNTAGVRHASSLGFAEWLGTSGHTGMIFARSDGGGASLFVPGPEKPRVYAFKTLEIPGQQLMLSLFKEKMMTNGFYGRRVLAQLARIARKGERVITVLDGCITADRLVEDENSMVLRASTIDHEYYLMGKARFESIYEQPGMDLSESDGSMKAKVYLECHEQQLIAKGFKLYRPKPSEGMKWVYEVTAEDLEQMPVPYFITSFGTTQSLVPGDLLAMPGPEERAVEIYRLHPFAFKALAFTLTMNELLAAFKEKVISQGTLMFKSTPALVRKAQYGETLRIILNSRAQLETTVSNDSSLVVSEPKVDDLYVLSAEKFRQLWEPGGTPIEENTPEAQLMKAQDWRWHKPKPRLIWVYQLVEEDFLSFKAPTVQFDTAFGIQTIHDGDHLGLPWPESEAKELFFIGAGNLSHYVRATHNL